MFSKRMLILVIPFLLCGMKGTDPSKKAADKLGVELAKQHKLRFLNSGFGNMIDDPDCFWALSFTSRESLSKEEAKNLIAQLAYKVLHKMYHDPLFAKYCAHRKSELKNEKIGFKLAFWDAEVNRPLFPYLAQVRLVDGKVHYYYADPKTQALGEPIIEDLNTLALIKYD